MRSVLTDSFPCQQFPSPLQILFTVKLVREDIDSQTEKPVIALKYNRVVAVPLCAAFCTICAKKKGC